MTQVSVRFSRMGMWADWGSDKPAAPDIAGIVYLSAGFTKFARSCPKHEAHHFDRVRRVTPSVLVGATVRCTLVHLQGLIKTL
jgi:hypothetical protein